MRKCGGSFQALTLTYRLEHCEKYFGQTDQRIPLHFNDFQGPQKISLSRICHELSGYLAMPLYCQKSPAY